MKFAEAKLPPDGKTLDNMSHLMRHVPASYFGHVKKFDDLTRVVGFGFDSKARQGGDRLFLPTYTLPPSPSPSTTSSASFAAHSELEHSVHQVRAYTMLTLNPESACDVCAEEYGPMNLPRCIPCGE